MNKLKPIEQKRLRKESFSNYPELVEGYKNGTIDVYKVKAKNQPDGKS